MTTRTESKPFSELSFGSLDATDEATRDPDRFMKTFFDPDHVADGLMSFD